MTTLIDLSDVCLNWPERYGHLLRVSRLVEGVAGVGKLDCKVEIWDGGLGNCQGVYVPSSKLIKLWSESSVLALTLVHELGHSLNRIAPSWWCKSEWSGDSYLSDPEELFARAFTQLVAVRTGDKTLLWQLEKACEYHWEYSEFLKIEEVWDENVGRSG